MKKAALRTAGTAVLGIALAAVAAGSAAAAPLSISGIDPVSVSPGFVDTGRALPVAQPVSQALGSLNPASGARVAAQVLRTAQPVVGGVANAADRIASQSDQQYQKRAVSPGGGFELTPTANGNGLNTPLGAATALTGLFGLLS
jgi:hypothetical protein